MVIGTEVGASPKLGVTAGSVHVQVGALQQKLINLVANEINFRSKIGVWQGAILRPLPQSESAFICV